MHGDGIHTHGTFHILIHRSCCVECEMNRFNFRANSYIDIYTQKNRFDCNRRLKTKAREQKFNLINKISVSA